MTDLKQRLAAVLASPKGKAMIEAGQRFSIEELQGDIWNKPRLHRSLALWAVKVFGLHGGIRSRGRVGGWHPWPEVSERHPGQAHSGGVEHGVADGGRQYGPASRGIRDPHHKSESVRRAKKAPISRGARGVGSAPDRRSACNGDRPLRSQASSSGCVCGASVARRN